MGSLFVISPASYSAYQSAASSFCLAPQTLIGQRARVMKLGELLKLRIMSGAGAC